MKCREHLIYLAGALYVIFSEGFRNVTFLFIGHLKHPLPTVLGWLNATVFTVCGSCTNKARLKFLAGDAVDQRWCEC